MNTMTRIRRFEILENVKVGKMNSQIWATKIAFSPYTMIGI